MLHKLESPAGMWGFFVGGHYHPPLWVITYQWFQIKFSKINLPDIRTI
jgi:hypothetical protein